MKATHIEIGVAGFYVTIGGTLKTQYVGGTFPLKKSIPCQDPETVFSARRFISSIKDVLTPEGLAEMETCVKAEHDGDGVSYYRFIGES